MMMGARACHPVALVELGRGQIWMVHVDGWAEVELGRFRGQQACTRYTTHPTNTENLAIKEWEQEDYAARYHLSRQLLDYIFIGLINHKTAKGRWD